MKNGAYELQILNLNSNKTDIQSMLFEYLKRKDKDTVSMQLGRKIDEIYELEEKDKFIESLKNNSKEQEEVVKEASNKSVKQNERELNLEEKEDKEEKKEELEYTKKQYMLKDIYEDTLEKYYTLKEQLYRRNIRENNELSFSDDEYNKLLLYSKYLKKIDIEFSKKSSFKHVAEEFKDTNELLNQNVRNEDKYQNHIGKEHDKQMLENKNLEEKMEALSKDIIDLDSSDPDYALKYDYMMQLYTRLDTKLHMKEPNVLKIQVDEERKQEENIIEDRVIGYNYQKEVKKKTYDFKNTITDRQEMSKAKKDGLNSNTKDTVSQKQAENIIDSHELVIAESLEAMVEKVNQGDIQGARQIYDKIKVFATEKEMQEAIDNDKKLKFEDIKPKTIKEKSNNIFKTDTLDIKDIVENMEEREEEKTSNENQIEDERNWLDENLNKSKRRN